MRSFTCKARPSRRGQAVQAVEAAEEWGLPSMCDLYGLKVEPTICYAMELELTTDAVFPVLPPS